VLKRFSAEDRADMLENGVITVTCEFCSTVYRFTPEEASGAGLDLRQRA
jgi:molecular chaperone Hsp33